MFALKAKLIGCIHKFKQDRDQKDILVNYVGVLQQKYSEQTSIIPDDLNNLNKLHNDLVNNNNDTAIYIKSITNQNILFDLLAFDYDEKMKLDHLALLMNIDQKINAVIKIQERILNITQQGC
jgi:hypothetical protein